MSNKKYPSNDKEWAKYLTVHNYFTENEIEYRKALIDDSACDYENVRQIVMNYRKQKTILFEFEEKTFYIVETHQLKENIDKIKNFWKTTEYFVKDKFSFELLKETLIYEGYYSSTIEGAHSTMKRARTLAKGHEEPTNKDEMMVLNNFKALMELRDKKSPLTHELIQDIHRITTDKTLEKESDIGIYRTEANEIVDGTQKVIFTPPANINTMNTMMNELLDFLKTDELGRPIDDIYKAIAFHFLFAYIHPFIDGNGRTVRILFTYLLKQSGYDMFYYISLSEIIYRKKAKDYYKAFIDVERSDISEQKPFDLTYFFYYMTNVMLKGLDILKNRINTHMREDIISHIAEENQIDLTPRQKKIVKILSNKDYSFMLSTKDLADKLNVGTQTILRDLKFLREFSLVKRINIRRKYFYKLNIDL